MLVAVQAKITKPVTAQSHSTLGKGQSFRPSNPIIYHIREKDVNKSATLKLVTKAFEEVCSLQEKATAAIIMEFPTIPMTAMNPTRTAVKICSQ